MNKCLRRDENGFASLVIALIMIIVLALLTVGFAQLARREQQSALDKQLATQAQDAAETGINDAYKDIQDRLITETNYADPNNCMSYPPGGYTSRHPISDGREVDYTCLLVDMTPPDLQFTGLTAGDNQNISFRTTTAAAASFTIKWRSTNGGSTNLPNTTSVGFLPSGTWRASPNDYPAVIQISLTPYDPGVITRSSLINTDCQNNSCSFTAYLYPVAGGAGTYIISSGNGPIVPASCSSGSCSVELKGFKDQYYILHLVDYYVTSNIVITANDVNGNSLNFGDGQVSIDVTGRAKNVVKRERVRAPIHQEPNLPSFAVEGQNLCKRIDTSPGLGNTSFEDLNGADASAGGSPNTECALAPAP